MLNPALYAFTAEFHGEHPAYDDFEEYIRTEFANRHPGWEPRFGEGMGSDPDPNPNDYVYLLHGSVPEATSHADAENKVKKLLHEIGQGFKSRRPTGEKGMPAPITRVWRWRQ